jgi:hypothetical protein
MGWLALLDWQIALSLLLPLAAAVALSLAEAHGPLSATIRKTVGIVPPYVAAITLLFGLFTTRLMNDVWEKDSVARQSVQAEDDSLRAIVSLAAVAGVRPQILPSVKDYAAAAGRESPYSKAAKNARVDADKAYDALLSAISKATLQDNAMKAAFLSTAAELRRARDRRLYAADDESATIKWVSILFLGFLTQVTILLVHVGNSRAAGTALAIFTAAFTFCVVIIAVFDQPFETTLVDEPTATLAHFRSLE